MTVLQWVGLLALAVFAGAVVPFQSAINANPELTANGKSAAQNRWIAYNKMRGQYNSAMEHAVPEQFWVDKSQCQYTDETGTIKNPSQSEAHCNCLRATSCKSLAGVASHINSRATE